MIPLVLAATDAPMQISVGGGSSAVKLFLLMTALSFAAGALISITSFTRIIIVMSFLRQALGTPSLPPNQVVVALSLALTGFVMAPTFTKVNTLALSPYLEDQITSAEAIDRGSAPVLEFLLKQTRPDDLRLFYELSGAERPTRAEQVPLHIAVPAFMVSELTTAFRMGLFLFIPLLLIDLLVSATLMALGMMMVPPTLVSLPLKVGIFLLADGWHLLVQSLVRSFG
ncbi:MAG: flagellar type III secretion system pore protein FliP [Archangium sp.]|nr:flagellar type III secretion system pore protein FliP [Archangium sp.]MDP3155037.1 flagellar type III secretion system pore protein FliP [Archangium sp.]MDP3574465.1 flagellar type III secretion system pore protein FliP [Archangium sp.]